jgi:hypothetical protein
MRAALSSDEDADSRVKLASKTPQRHRELGVDALLTDVFK